MWSRLRSKLRYVVRGSRIDRDLAQELDFHQDMLVRDQEQLGYSRGTAMLNARRKMGNTPLMMEYSRDAWIIAWFDTLIRDIRYCLRSFARNPGFAFVALLTLALGIGANTAIFRLVDTVMLRSLAVDHPEQLLAIRGAFSYWRFEQLRDRNEVFSGVFGAHTLQDVAVSADAQPLGHASTELVSGNYFSLLGVRPILGRPITPDDDRAAGAGAVAVISHGLWQRAFAGSPAVLGRTIRLRGGTLGGAGTSGFEPDAPNVPRHDEAVLTIIGVAPPEYFGDTVGKLVDIWVPITMQPILMPGRAWLTRRTASWVNVMGRRRLGISEDQARESLTILWQQIRADEIGPSISEQQKRNLANARLNVESGEKGFAQLRRQFSQLLLILMTVVTLVLLIACLNVANLLMARATSRQQEISMRLSLGATRARLVRQLLTESLLLAGTGGVLGLLLATLGAQVLVDMVAGDAQQITLRLAPDRRILAFTAGVTLLSGVLFGLVPALRGTHRGLHHTLKDTSRTAGGRRSAAKMLVAVQIAVSLVLLVGCGLFLRTLYNLKAETLGYDRTGLIIVRADPVGAGYKGDEISRAVVALMHRLAALPGVRSVTFSENGLFSGTESGTPIDVEGFKPASDEDRAARFDQAGPGYFTNVGIPLVLGRDFNEHDVPGTSRVTIINETLARFYFPNQNPIGRHIRVRGPSDVSLEIVGVARDAQDHSLRSKPVRRFYVSYMQPIDGITTVNFEIRAASNAGALFGAIRSEIQRFDPRLHILSLKAAQTLVDESIVTERLIAKLSTFFGGLAVLLAAIGLYGVMSYTVARRTSEIGLRVALGAARSAVASMILKEIIGLIVIGSIAGAALALSFARFMESLLFGLKPHDPMTVAASACLLLVIGLIAGYLPARRAARVDPIVALRTE
jgi:predicted permease